MLEDPNVWLVIAAGQLAAVLTVPHHEVKGLRRLKERSLVDEILERLPDLEVHAVVAKSGETRS